MPPRDRAVVRSSTAASRRRRLVLLAVLAVAVVAIATVGTAAAAADGRSSVAGPEPSADDALRSLEHDPDRSESYDRTRPDSHDNTVSINHDRTRPPGNQTPEELPGRTDVIATDEYSNSTIGLVTRNRSGPTGVLVSDSHVLTAAHVATDDGEPYDDLLFLPGYRATPTDVDAPYGVANVTDVDVHPEYDPNVSDPAHDLALLRLDRPVGRLAGHADFGVWSEGFDWATLRHAGYANAVAGQRQLASDVAYDPTTGVGSDATVSVCGPLGFGDSGSPLFVTVDGRPHVLGVAAELDLDARACDAHQVEAPRVAGETLELVRSWMRADDEPPTRAELRVATGDDARRWHEPTGPVADPPIAPADEPATFRARVYNDGPLSLANGSGSRSAGSAPVEFSLRTGDRDWQPVCTATVSPGAYESAIATCTVDGLPEWVEGATNASVAVEVDPDDEVPEYGDARTGRVELGTVPVESTRRDGVRISVERAPETVTHATEVVSVRATVEAPAGTDGPVDVELLANGSAIATERFDPAAAASTDVRLRGDVDLSGRAELELTVRAGDASDGVTVPVRGPLNETFGEGLRSRPHGEDGRYRDVDGDGELGHADVQAFFGVQHRPSVQAYPAYFDFDDNGRVGHGDVVELFQAVARQSL